MKPNILIVEDEVKISDLIGKYLTMEGYNHRKAFDGNEAIKIFHDYQPDLVILDIMLPDIDGFQVCEKIRAESATPIVFLTARTGDVDLLLGFDKGGDDYLCKPFDPRELMARLKAILRRIPHDTATKNLTHGPILLNENEHSLQINGNDIQLTQIEFNILRALMSRPNKVFSRDELLSAGQGSDTESYERTIDFHIKNIRKKINISDDLNHIKSVYGVGYKFLNTPN